MKVVDIRQSRAKQAKAGKKTGEKLPPEHLASLTKIPSTAIKSSDEDDFDMMVKNMAKDSERLLRGSAWLISAAERLRKDSEDALKKD